MNKLHVLCGFLALVAAVACHPIGPPGSHPAPRRPAAGAMHAASAPVNPTDPLPSPADPATGVPPTPADISPPVQTLARPTSPSTTPAPSLPQASKPATPKDPYVTAQKAPNKPGYVLSPHTGKLALVDGIPSGVVVPDQTCPPGEKKFFRVP